MMGGEFMKWAVHLLFVNVYQKEVVRILALWVYNAFHFVMCFFVMSHESWRDVLLAKLQWSQLYGFSPVCFRLCRCWVFVGKWKWSRFEYWREQERRGGQTFKHSSQFASRTSYLYGRHGLTMWLLSILDVLVCTRPILLSHISSFQCATLRLVCVWPNILFLLYGFYGF